MPAAVNVSPGPWCAVSHRMAPGPVQAGLLFVFVRIEGNLAVVGNEYMVSKHRGGRAPPTRFRVAGGKGIR